MSHRTYELSELPAGQLPSRPATLRPFEGLNQTFEEEVERQLSLGHAVALGGLSLIGERGYMVSTLGVITYGSETPEGFNLKGWSLHIGHPDEKYRQLRHFDTQDDTEDVLLPLPNVMVHFGCEVDPSIAEEDANPQDLAEIAHFVSAFISDGGPPEGIDW